MGQRIAITSVEGTFGAYIARPASSPKPAVVVLHEIHGVNADIRKTCDELASSGFIAVAPDLFWRGKPSVNSDVQGPSDWTRGLRQHETYDRNAGAKDVKETISAVADLSGCSGKVAVLGYCLGGLMAYLTAARYSLDAAVSYYGVGIDRYLDEADSLTVPFLMHLAEADEFISAAAQQEIKAALANKPNVTIHSYPGQHHGFARNNGAHHDSSAAALAKARTFEFLNRTLQLVGGA